MDGRDRAARDRGFGRGPTAVTRNRDGRGSLITRTARSDGSTDHKTIEKRRGGSGSLRQIGAATDQRKLELARAVEIDARDGDFSLIVDQGWHLSHRAGTTEDE